MLEAARLRTLLNSLLALSVAGQIDGTGRPDLARGPLFEDAWANPYSEARQYSRRTYIAIGRARAHSLGIGIGNR